MEKSGNLVNSLNVMFTSTASMIKYLWPLPTEGGKGKISAVRAVLQSRSVL